MKECWCGFSNQHQDVLDLHRQITGHAKERPHPSEDRMVRDDTSSAGALGVGVKIVTISIALTPSKDHPDMFDFATCRDDNPAEEVVYPIRAGSVTSAMILVKDHFVKLGYALDWDEGMIGRASGKARIMTGYIPAPDDWKQKDPPRRPPRSPLSAGEKRFIFGDVEHAAPPPRRNKNKPRPPRITDVTVSLAVDPADPNNVITVGPPGEMHRHTYDLEQ